MKVYHLFSLGILGLLMSCNSTSSVPDDVSPVIVSLDIEEKSVDSIHDLQAEFMVKNTSLKTISYTFGSGCQHGYSVTQKGEVVLDSRGLYGCIAVITTLELGPRESVKFEINLSGLPRDLNIDPGEYELSAFLLNDYSEPTGSSFVIR